MTKLVPLEELRKKFEMLKPMPPNMTYYPDYNEYGPVWLQSGRVASSEELYAYNKLWIDYQGGICNLEIGKWLPVELSEDMAKALLVTDTLDEDDWLHACEAWALLRKVIIESSDYGAIIDEDQK